MHCWVYFDYYGNKKLKGFYGSHKNGTSSATYFENHQLAKWPEKCNELTGLTETTQDEVLDLFGKKDEMMEKWSGMYVDDDMTWYYLIQLSKISSFPQ